MVDQLIDPETKMWNMDLINEIIDPVDIPLIGGILISRIFKEDTFGWHFTKSGRYTVKSGYWTEHKYPTLEKVPCYYGPDIRPLQAQAWKLKCAPKIRHFIWQVISGCLAVCSNLRKRGINCDSRCVRCGAEEETINHTLFECPPSVQVWALSKIPSILGQFPGTSIYSNMDHLFWRVPRIYKDDSFPWILWFIWKARNDKVYKNIDRSPQETLKLAESESLAWASAQVNDINKLNQGVQNNGATSSLQSVRFDGFRCYIDGSWKETDNFSGLGWFCFQDDEEGKMIGACNTRRCLSPLHAELEALIWAMSSLIAQQKTRVAFATDSSELVSMVSSPAEWPAFSTHLEIFAKMKISFSIFSLSLISRNLNSKADKLARSARLYPHFIFHVNSVPPVWLSEPF